MIPTLAKETVSIDCDIQAETPKAILLRAADVDGEIVKQWIPLSQVQEIHRKETITSGLFTDRVVMSKWIAHDRNLTS